MNRKTLITKLHEAAERVPLTHVNPSKMDMTVLKNASDWLVADKRTIDGLIDQIRALKAELGREIARRQGTDRTPTDSLPPSSARDADLNWRK